MTRLKLVSVLGLTLALSACEATKEELGLTRRTPDEFSVVQRAPLEMPPEYYLRPPTPGAARPQEQTPADQAAAVLLRTPRSGAKGRSPSKSEISLLTQSDAGKADPAIRQRIDDETRAIAEKDKPTIHRILDIGGKTQGPAQVVDAPAEAARIKASKQGGKPLTQGETPSITK